MLYKVYQISKKILQSFQSLALLFARFVIAYGFFEPALNKWKDISSTAEWFNTLGIPLPTLNAYMAATTEMLGVVLLTIGFMTRLISVPLMFVMVVAITTVHWTNGFSSGSNGFEIPLYYMLFLFIFATFGAGKFSLDYFLFEKKK